MNRPRHRAPRIAALLVIAAVLGGCARGRAADVTAAGRVELVEAERTVTLSNCAVALVDFSWRLPMWRIQFDHAGGRSGKAILTLGIASAESSVRKDDLGCGDVGCYGQRFIRTPRLDRMADEGMRLTDHLVAASAAPSVSFRTTGRPGVNSGQRARARS